MASRKRATVAEEGPEAARRFEGAMTRVLSVSKEELQKREGEYKQRRKDEKSKPTKRAISR